jgi:hypothetical protein
MRRSGDGDICGVIVSVPVSLGPVQHFGPLFKGQIGRHDQAGLFVSPAHHVKEQLRPRFREGDIVQFIEDQ